MKKEVRYSQYFIGVLWSIMLLGGLLFMCYHPTEKKILDKLDEKYIPSDHFFLQRSFPDASINLAAYSKALKKAKNTAKPRNNFENFDKEWRTEGPGNLGARINTIDVHPTNPSIIFAGYSAGGIFRTKDGGNNWEPVFDDQLFLAIGDLVFDPIDPNTIYVGTGDVNISGFPFLGDGLYKSTDLGETWTYMGLEETRIISKILIDPNNNQIIYVATMGLPFEPTQNRGLYKSIDGGETWEQILFLGETIGVIDVVFAPNNTDILFAAGWDRLRNNQVSKTSGQGAKIYRSSDTGSTWTQLEGGLPQTDQSRIGLATTSESVLAVYVNPSHHFQGLYKTNDLGNTWITLPTDSEKNNFNTSVFAGFGWYFSKIRVNPKDDKDISVLGVWTYRTFDEGENWEIINTQSSIHVHADVHDLVFTSDNKVLMGTDGGMYRFDVQGGNWQDIEDIPTTQIYRVAYNPHESHNYFMGAQDNGTASGNANTISQWQEFNWGGDGFQMAFHPTEPDIFYTESQRGNIAVTTNGGEQFQIATEGIDPADRKNWDQPYFISSHNPNVLFTGTHRVYKSVAGAIPLWEAIGPDLTDGDTDHIENGLRHSIATLDQSPINADIIYAGTTDGNMWRTLNDGMDWEKLNGLPKRYFTEVVASPSDEAVVYATVSGYKDNENTAHIYKSIDNGMTWESIASNLPPLAINSLEVIPNNEDQVLFVGTDGGVYGTINGGASWERLGSNLPIIAVYDTDWNKAENRLIIGTFARSVLSYPLEGIANADNTLSSVNFKKEEDKTLKLYPNPVQIDLNIEFYTNRPNQILQISIFDIQGRLMKQIAKRAEREIHWKVDISELSVGTYILKINGEFLSYKEQFIKL